MDPNKSLEKPKHERKVSWGTMVTTLRKEKQQDQSSNKKLNLSDVISSKPAENESVTHFMKSIDKVPSSKDNEEDPETESLYRDIAAEELSHDASSTKNVQEDEEPAAAAPAALSVASSHQQSQFSLGSGGPGSNKAKFKSLVKRHIIASKDAHSTIFGLAAAMKEMEEEERKMNGNDESNSNDGSDGGDVESQGQTHESDSNESANDVENPGATGNKGSKNKKKKHHHFRNGVANGFEHNVTMFKKFVGNKKDKLYSYLKKVILFIMLPSLAISAILFYSGNPARYCEATILEEQQADAPVEEVPIYDDNGKIIGYNETAVEEEERSITEILVCPGMGASVSWWFLFVGVRQVVTFSLALLTQALVIDFWALGSRFFLSWFGPLPTLLLVQSKGWPFILVFWGIYDLILLSGDHQYTHHWAYWQDWLGIFNEKNPSGDVVTNEWYLKVLRLAIFVGVLSAVKRLLVALFLGRQTFARFGEQLADVMKNMVMIGEVGSLAKDIELYSGDYANNDSALPRSDGIQDLMVEAQASSDSVNPAAIMNAAEAANQFIQQRNSASDLPNASGSVSSRSLKNDTDFTKSEQLQLTELLDAWEEPQTAEEKEDKKITLGAVLQFRQALTFMKARYPFMPAFGLADTREHCIDSAQQVYERLLLRTPNQSVLAFDTLALLAKNDKGGIDQQKAKLLIKLFRPDRDGTLTKLDFVKSIDEVYKSIRMLSANVSNSFQIEKAVKRIINIFFYIVVGAICLSQLGVDPLQLFFSLSSALLAFAFMFGSASSKTFEGILFILVQSPYGVGDRIHFSRPDQPTSIDGSASWIIEKVGLFSTSVFWAATNERATIANSAIASMRVINGARSPHAQIFVNMKFAIDTPYEKIEIFKQAIEQYLKDRPREWLAFVAFRPTEATVEQGYINYVTIAQHRSSWQDVGSVKASTAELVTYSLEIAKKLDMRYKKPPLPVDLKFNRSESGDQSSPFDMLTNPFAAAPSAGANPRKYFDE